MVSTSALPLLASAYDLNREPWVSAIDNFDFAFAENGLTAYKLGKPLESQSFIKYVGEERYKKLVNFILHYVADLDIPIKRYFMPTPLSYVNSDRSN